MVPPICLFWYITRIIQLNGCPSYKHTSHSNIIFSCLHTPTNALDISGTTFPTVFLLQPNMHTNEGQRDGIVPPPLNLCGRYNDGVVPPPPALCVNGRQIPATVPPPSTLCVTKDRQINGIVAPLPTQCAPNKVRQDRLLVPSPPSTLSIKESRSSPNCDHDYEELVSQRNSINEIIAKKVASETIRKEAIASSGAPQCYQNSSLIPIIAMKKVQQPSCFHDYDEPDERGSEKSVHQNKSLQQLSPFKKDNVPFAGRRRALTVAGPRVKRGSVTSSKTEDYEVPVSSYGHPILQRARSATVTESSRKHGQRLHSFQINKAKNKQVAIEMHEHRKQASPVSRSEDSDSSGKEETAGEELQEGDVVSNGTGSRLSEQDTVVCHLFTKTPKQYHAAQIV